MTNRPLVMPTTRLGMQRTIPPEPSPEVRERLRGLLDQAEGWHLRGAWSAWLGGEEFTLSPISDMTPDQRVAAIAWLRQQRHALHRAVHGDTSNEAHVAPDGWIEQQAIYRALTAKPIPKGPRHDLPAEPSFALD